LELLTGTNLPSYEKRAEWWGRVSDKSCWGFFIINLIIMEQNLFIHPAVHQ
jgi:hypothetical protein